MRIPIYQIDAFSSQPFKGNPAAVCPLEEWLPDEVMQSIAMENNLSETAFFIKNEDQYDIRWFAPKIEIDLAGHPTLATAHVIFNEMNHQGDTITFKSKISDILEITRNKDIISMNFPSRPPKKIYKKELIEEAIGVEVEEFYENRDGLAVVANEEIVTNLSPSMDKISKLDYIGLIVTSRGENVDFVSRFFAPQIGVPEDPVTGSAHCELIPLWAEKLNKNKLTAKQLSSREGTLYCEYLNDRVIIGGEAVTVLSGELII
jgi:PhzF family phenazine biosynthesis protein